MSSSSSSTPPSSDQAKVVMMMMENNNDAASSKGSSSPDSWVKFEDSVGHVTEPKQSTEEYATIDIAQPVAINLPLHQSNKTNSSAKLEKIDTQLEGVVCQTQPTNGTKGTNNGTSATNNGFG